jgi:hypothetical protein
LSRIIFSTYGNQLGYLSLDKRAEYGMMAKEIVPYIERFPEPDQQHAPYTKKYETPNKYRAALIKRPTRLGFR